MSHKSRNNINIDVEKILDIGYNKNKIADLRRIKMGEVKLKVEDKFLRSERIKALQKRRAISKQERQTFNTP